MFIPLFNMLDLPSQVNHQIKYYTNSFYLTNSTNDTRKEFYVLLYNAYTHDLYIFCPSEDIESFTISIVQAPLNLNILILNSKIFGNIKCT